MERSNPLSIAEVVIGHKFDKRCRRWDEFVVSDLCKAAQTFILKQSEAFKLSQAP